jgi:O-antigen ligase
MFKAEIKKKVFSPFWLCCWAAFFSISWLLPNHYYPWFAFHLDAWASIFLLIAAAIVIWRSEKKIAVNGFVLFWITLLFIPGIQTLFGLIELAGVAWISTLYIAGFCLALLIGIQWESYQPGQLGDALFLAIGIASLASVGLQLQQWLQIDGIELWTMGSVTARPHANVGQPNQLGTFLLWGLLSVGWGWTRHRIGSVVAVCMAAFLLFGLALAASRTAWIGLMAVVMGAWYWRKCWTQAGLPLAVTGLGLYFALLIAIQPWLQTALLGDTALLPPDYSSPMSGHIRLDAWAALGDAVLQRPWFGYGWYQVVPAQMAVAAAHPTLLSVFTSAHNLFLDLFLWCGIPLGLVISVALLCWSWRVFGLVRHGEEAVMVLFLAVVANHSMLELPLHYAYFLLPVGLVMGVLNMRLNKNNLFILPNWINKLAWFFVSLLLVLIVRDYSRIEASYENFRMEKMRIQVTHLPPPDVLLLTQWSEFMVVAYTEPKRNMNQSDIDRARKIASFFGGPLFMHKLAQMLALNNQGEEAKLWLVRLCKTSPVADCDATKKSWERESQQFSEIAAIPWPTSATK